MDIKFNFDLDKFVCPLQVAFIVLKLLGKITWSWIWVLAPMWGSFIFVGIVMLVGWVKLRKK